ncbi:MAG TPA: oxygenase MpaB family protein [Polyangiaceae bacterium]|nr:oxygenase MpaB family protein [Polyangiaceae bacterium]
MPSAPTRFRHPLDSPDPVAQHYYGRFLKSGKAPPWREQADGLAAALWRGDPLADAWVEKSDTLDRARAEDLLESALENRRGALAAAPFELVALFEQLRAVPLWVDPSAIEQGCRTARRAGPIAGAVLSGFSLMGGYRSSAVVKPLIMTGKLRDGASRRLTETGRFVVAITEPGALHGPEAGFQACVRVRLLHARIRRRLARSADWKAEAWGLPINQADMLGTNLLFSLGFLIGARELGMSFSGEEAESVIHLWRYVGYLLGIDETLLPASEREAERIMYLVGASQPAPDADSVELARALHREPLERARSERQRRMARAEMVVRAALSRILLGDQVADELELPKSSWRFGIRFLVPLVALLERVRRATPFGNEVAYLLGERWIKRAVARPLGP